MTITLCHDSRSGPHVHLPLREIAHAMSAWSPVAVAMYCEHELWQIISPHSVFIQSSGLPIVAASTLVGLSENGAVLLDTAH